jgi:hypothetical protein
MRVCRVAMVWVRANGQDGGGGRGEMQLSRNDPIWGYAWPVGRRSPARGGVAGDGRRARNADLAQRPYTRICGLAGPGRRGSARTAWPAVAGGTCRSTETSMNPVQLSTVGCRSSDGRGADGRFGWRLACCPRVLLGRGGLAQRMNRRGCVKTRCTCRRSGADYLMGQGRRRVWLASATAKLRPRRPARSGAPADGGCGGRRPRARGTRSRRGG